MALSLDILKNDLFSYANLQRVAGQTTYVPQQLGLMQLFEPEPIIGDIVHLYEEDQTIRFVPTTERGTPDIRLVPDQGRLRALKTRRLSQVISVRASELFGIANEALSETVRLRNAGQLLTKRTGIMKSNLEATKELHRLGAMLGVLLDADGTTILEDYFANYGISAPPVVDIDWANIPEEELLMFFQDTFLRTITIALRDAGRLTPNVTLGALVGDGFWRKLMTHPGFRQIYVLQMNAMAVARAQNPLVQPNNWTTVEFAGVRWINYQGMTTGPLRIPFDEARFFPIGARDVFKVFWGSGETLLDVTEPGRPEYLYVIPDPNTTAPEFMDAKLRSYPLYANIFPKALMRARVKPA